MFLIVLLQQEALMGFLLSALSISVFFFQAYLICCKSVLCYNRPFQAPSPCIIHSDGLFIC